MRILITGADGQLGRAISRSASADGHVVVAMGRGALDITDIRSVAQIAEASPDVVVNAAAMTDVDGCERDKDAAFRINALGARNVALGAASAGAALVQISTDYVFDGRSDEPYWEFDATNPLGAYGASKLAGEREVLAVWHRSYIVRTAWLYGVGGRNFVTKMLGLAESRDEISVVNNEVGNPTFCDDLAEGVISLVGSNAYGTYHLVNEGWCSRYDLARAILEMASLGHVTVRPIRHFERLACPPAFAPLRNFSASELGIALPTWQDGLARFFAGREETDGAVEQTVVG